LLLVAISINGEPRDGDYLVARRDGGFLLQAADLARWRIGLPAAPPVAIDGEQYAPVSALAGMAARFDAATQTLALTVPAELFEAQRLRAGAAPVRPTDSAFAAFVNYDVTLGVGDGASAAAFIEGGVSDDWGFVANTMTAGEAALGGGLTRLETHYVRDDPENLTRLVIGDTITDAPEWSRQVRFGGVRFGSDFSLQPNLVTFPTPDLAGQAVVPSTVELLVNDALRFQTDVGQGPFSIDQPPVVTGAGDVTLVTRDALGVERRVRSSYYVSPDLLRPGLSAWSIEAGGERRDYGSRSFSYGNPFVAGSFRRGISNNLTLGARAEISGDVQMLGGDASFVFPPVGEFGVAAAASHGDEGEGLLYRAFVRRVTPDWSLALSYQRASRRFDQLGVHDEDVRIADQLQATAGLSLGDWGSVAASYVDLRYADGERTRLASANYSVAVADRAFLNAFVLHSDSDTFASETTLGVGLTIAFGAYDSAYVQADNDSVRGELRRTPPTQGGWGYRLAASAGGTDRQQAEIAWRGDIGEVSAEAANHEGETQGRLLARGGVLLAGERVHATRRVEGGVGIVEVPGQADVRIYQENRPVGRTDENGRAVIPDLRPYEPNRIAIEPADLPLDVEMPDPAIVVVPRYRGAADARFAIEQRRPAVIVVQTPEGAPVAAGSTARAGGQETFVGNGGEIFVEQFSPGMTIDIETADGVCRAIVPDRPPEDILPRIGPLRCRMGDAQ
jgi:outer membrane usher protein